MFCVVHSFNTSFNGNKESFIISKTCKLIEVKRSQQTWLIVKFVCSIVLKYCLLVGHSELCVISICVVNVAENKIHSILIRFRNLASGALHQNNFPYLFKINVFKVSDQFWKYMPGSSEKAFVDSLNSFSKFHGRVSIFLYNRWVYFYTIDIFSGWYTGSIQCRCSKCM